MTPKSMNYLNFSNKSSRFPGFMNIILWHMKVMSKAGLKPRPTDSYMFFNHQGPLGQNRVQKVTTNFRTLKT